MMNETNIVAIGNGFDFHHRGRNKILTSNTVYDNLKNGKYKERRIEESNEDQTV